MRPLDGAALVGYVIPPIVAMSAAMSDDSVPPTCPPTIARNAPAIAVRIPKSASPSPMLRGWRSTLNSRLKMRSANLHAKPTGTIGSCGAKRTSTSVKSAAFSIPRSATAGSMRPAQACAGRTRMRSAVATMISFRGNVVNRAMLSISPSRTAGIGPDLIFLAVLLDRRADRVHGKR